MATAAGPDAAQQDDESPQEVKMPLAPDTSTSNEHWTAKSDAKQMPSRQHSHVGEADAFEPQEVCNVVGGHDRGQSCTKHSDTTENTCYQVSLP